MKHLFGKIYLFFFALFLVLHVSSFMPAPYRREASGAGFQALAASLAVTPAVIDLKAKARDILKEKILLTNNANYKINIYTFVNNITAADGQQTFLDPAKADLSSSLANWLSISRGVIDLLPGEKKTIDFLIEVNLRVKPGLYHGLISFAEGTTRAEAAKKLREAPAVTVNLEVLEDIKERLQLKKFIPDQTFFSGWPVKFSYLLENVGNRALAHSGEIRIYNRRGEETAAIPANQGEVLIEPGQAKELAVVWQAPTPMLGVGGAGRYKALLNLDYGSKPAASVQDTVFFWVIPWPKILIIFTALASLIIFLTIFWHRKYGA